MALNIDIMNCHDWSIEGNGDTVYRYIFIYICMYMQYIFVYTYIYVCATASGSRNQARKSNQVIIKSKEFIYILTDIKQ